MIDVPLLPNSGTSLSFGLLLAAGVTPLFLLHNRKEREGEQRGRNGGSDNWLQHVNQSLVGEKTEAPSDNVSVEGRETRRGR